MRADTSPMNGYDAFISYSQAVSGKLATALQEWLERFATPWYRPRSLRIFRDYTNLSASEDLWQTIEQALSSSRHFILLASPEAAQSKWVNSEVRWWRDNKPADKVLVVLTAGELHWDDEHNDWDWERTTSLPSAARGMFSHEPLWVDLSSVQTTTALDRSNPVLLNSVAQIAAPLRGVDKDFLVGEHINYYRRARRQRRGGIVALAVLTAAAVAAASIARIQADNATNQTNIATGRALATAAIEDIGGNLDLAQLLAVEAYQINPNTDSRSALFQAVTANPALVRYLHASSTVSAVAGSGNGRIIIAGTQRGQVERWTTGSFSEFGVAQLGKSITSVSVSEDGNTVAAADGAEAIAWTSRAGAHTIDIPHGQVASLTAVSSSGRYVLVYSHAPGLQNALTVPGTLSLLDMKTGAVVRAGVTGTWVDAAMPSDREVVLLRRFPGRWERRALPTLALTASAKLGFGIIDYAWALSPNGDLVTYSNGSPVLSLWKTEPNVTTPGFRAASAGPIPNALAISPDGQAVVTADNGSLYVGSINKAGAGTAPARQLNGSPAINPGSLTFFGDSSHILSASGSLVALWNLKQLSRIATQVSTPVPVTCVECSGDWLSVSPGNRAAIISYAGTPPIVQQLDPAGEAQQFPSSGGLTYLGPVAWSPDGRRLFMPTSAGMEVRSRSPGLPVVARWPDVTSTGFVKAISTYNDGKYLVVVGATNLIEIENAATGKVLKRIRGPGGSEADALGPNAETAAINGDGTDAAIITPTRGVEVINLQTGKVSAVPVSDAFAVQFGGSYLAILLVNGGVDLWSLEHDSLTANSGDSNVSAFSINTQGTMLAKYEEDDSVLLEEPGSGNEIGSLDVASPALGNPTSLNFTNDGTSLLIAVESYGTRFVGKLEQWNLSESGWMRSACTTAGVGMTAGEWGEVVGTQAPAKLACDGG